MPSKKPARAAAATATAKPTAAALKTPEKTPERLPAPFGRTATLIIAGCVMAGGILFAARQQTQPLLTTTPRQDVVLAPEVHPSRVVSSNMPAANASSPAGAKAAAPVTITGCLEVDNDTFRIKDTSGADAPTSRSWK
jgi:hypothetical protein